MTLSPPVQPDTRPVFDLGYCQRKRMRRALIVRVNYDRARAKTGVC
jgi:hypothetical protein